VSGFSGIEPIIKRWSMPAFKSLGFAIAVATAIWLADNPSLAADCAQGDALNCYTEALVRLQAAEDALGVARKEISGLQTQIDALTRQIAGLTIV
jgi:hypothetical protein